jgi:hypothetical protein
MRIMLSTFLLSVAITPAIAQAPLPQADKATASQCEESLKFMSLVKPDKDYAVRSIPEGCIISNGIYDTKSFMGWSFERVVIEVDRLQDYLSDTPDMSKTLPRWGRVTIDGARLKLQTDSLTANYLTSVQQWPMDISASYRFNPESGYLHIQNAEISSTKLGKASISAQINLPVSSSFASLVDQPAVTLSHLRMRLDNQGMWENFAMPAVVNYAALPSETGESNPEADIARLRDLASTGIEMLPDNQIDTVSRKALLKFIQDMPHPTGFLTVDFEFDPPLPVDLNLIESDQFAERALVGGKLTARYRAR